MCLYTCARTWTCRLYVVQYTTWYTHDHNGRSTWRQYSWTRARSRPPRDLIQYKHTSITGVIWIIETHSANTHSSAVGLSKAIEVIILAKSIEGLHTASQHFSSAIRVMKALHPQVPQQTLLYWKGQLQMLKWRHRCAATQPRESRIKPSTALTDYVRKEVSMLSLPQRRWWKADGKVE